MEFKESLLEKGEIQKKSNPWADPEISKSKGVPILLNVVYFIIIKPLKFRWQGSRQ